MSRKEAWEVLEQIAECQAAYDAAPEQFKGYIVAGKRGNVDLVFFDGHRMAPLTINGEGVVCSRTLMDDGRNWYGYTLDPFGQHVRFSVSNLIAKALLMAYRTDKGGKAMIDNDVSFLIGKIKDASLLEQALALGFSTIAEMREHAEWLKNHGSKAYREWATKVIAA